MKFNFDKFQRIDIIGSENLMDDKFSINFRAYFLEEQIEFVKIFLEYFEKNEEKKKKNECIYFIRKDKIEEGKIKLKKHQHLYKVLVYEKAIKTFLIYAENVFDAELKAQDLVENGFSEHIKEHVRHYDRCSVYPVNDRDKGELEIIEYE